MKKAIQDKDVVLGLCLFMPSPALVEVLGYVGFDFVEIDTEHSPCGPLSTETLEHLTRAANVADIAPIVRVTENDPNMIAKVLDAGAVGIVAPHIKTKEDVISVVRAAKYPPVGERGACTATRATKYLSAFDDDYWRRANEETIVAPLIEHKEAVENIEEILSVKGIDFIVTGPRDLSLSLGLSSVSHPTVKQYLDRVAESCKRSNIPVVGNVSEPLVESAKKLIDDGFRILYVGSDLSIIHHTFRDIVKRVNSEVKPLVQTGQVKLQQT